MSILIDGSYGEGGGQIVRVSVSMAALFGKSIRVINIRAKRPKPGLRPQHLKAIETVAKLSRAEVRGLKIGSTELEFYPHEIRGGKFTVDVGTAGSITLILQAVVPLGVISQEPIDLQLVGGTDVPFSPPIDYIRNLFLRFLRKIGYSMEIEVLRRGYYPKGGGIVNISMKPPNELRPIELIHLSSVEKIRGISYCSRLPAHVAERQARAAERILEAKGLEGEIEIEVDEGKALSPGSGIVLWAEGKDTFVGGDSLGQKGKRAEKVGEEAANKVIMELNRRAPVDRHMADMILPYLLLSSGRSKYRCTEITEHLLTEVHVLQRIVNTRININRESRLIEVEGVGKR